MLKKRSTKQLIIDSTAELLRTSSMEGMTVRAIAANCGITTQTFYNHFQDKYQVVARLYTDSMAAFVEADLDEWFDRKFEFTMGDMPMLNHAFDYTGQNNLTDTLISFDSQKYLLHVRRDIDLKSPEGKLIRQAINAFIYGQFGLYNSVRKGDFDLTSKEFDKRFSNVAEIMLMWAPKILDGKLMQSIQCESAFWDSDSERIIGK